MADPKCYVLVRGRNALPYVERCLRSILCQTYSNIVILFVDDASEYNRETKKKINKQLERHIVVWRKERYYSVRNAYEMIHTYCDDPEGIVINLDADDWFSTPRSVERLVRFYKKEKCLFSYGDCYVWSGQDSGHTEWSDENFAKLNFSSLPLASKYMEACNISYTKKVNTRRNFRDIPFVVLHPRSWKVKAFRLIPKTAFQRPDGTWLHFCEDQAIFFSLFEMFPERYAVCPLPLSVYNQANPAADIKRYRLETLRDEIEIRRKPKYATISL
ncbi:glycosyltransferase family 2 protein [Patescibacteria group bacterium]|nr:glycosyltransferase family 2 protein [Patescibacteria group bacterium]